ncbi:MAG: TlpA family protein disulfide reductase [Bacteroidetes bacterium]|nr:TlpA family protein disulfide reductase [Bacteroidota bacterium]
MKNILLLTLISSSLFAYSQGINAKVSGNIFNTTADSVFVAQYNGSSFINLAGSKIDAKGNFEIKVKANYPDFYVFRMGEARINLIIRNEDDIKIYADGKNINAFCNIVNSDESANMKEFIIMMEYYNQKRSEAIQQIQSFPGQEAEIKASLDREYSVFVSNRQSFIAQNPNSPILLPALTTIDADQDWATYDMVAKQLQFALPGSPTIENAYKTYLQMKAQKEEMDFLSAGKIAPDFQETKIDGSTMKLSDLKGKIVLLDFWASWCGPCRQENPNVVRLYEKYKSKGFTVMSVSLDQDRGKWLAAIEKDKLAWPNHVSDLKGWSSAAGKQYAVRGIPFTVLIDKEGKIIDTKLRGEQLEQELARIFGE